MYRLHKITYALTLIPALVFGVCARDHDELPDPDVRVGAAHVLVGGDRDGAGDRVYPRDRAARDEDAGELLGRYDARDTLGAAADSDGVCADAGVAGRG